MRLLLFVCFLGFCSTSESQIKPIDASETGTNTSVTPQTISSSTEHSTTTVIMSSSNTARKTVSTSGDVIEGDDSTVTTKAPTVTTPKAPTVTTPKAPTVTTPKAPTVTTLTPSIIPGVVTSPAATDLTSTTSVTSLGQSSNATVQPERSTARAASGQTESSSSTTQDSTKNKNSTAVNNHEPTTSTISTTSVNIGTTAPGSTQHANTSVSTLFNSTPASVTVTRGTNDSLQTNETILRNATAEGCSQNATAEGCSQNATAEGCSQNATAEGCSQNATANGTQENPPTETQGNPPIGTQGNPPIGTQGNPPTETQETAQKNASTNSKTNIQSQVYCVAESSGQTNILELHKKMDCKTFEKQNGKALGKLLCSALAEQENLTGFTHCEIRLSPVKEPEGNLNIDIFFKVDENKISRFLLGMQKNLSELDVHFHAPQESEERQSATALKKLIAMVVTGSLLLLVFLAAIIYRCTQHKSQHKKDPYLTEEMRAVDNGCHDNPAMDFSERESEMQEKQPNSKGNFLENTDTYIVPMDNLTKDELEEEDTHL